VDTTIDSLIQTYKESREADGSKYTFERMAKELSEELDGDETVTGTTIQRWCSDTHIPDDAYHPALAAVLGISEDDVERAVRASHRRRRARDKAKKDAALEAKLGTHMDQPPAPSSRAQPRQRGSRARRS